MKNDKSSKFSNAVNFATTMFVISHLRSQGHSFTTIIVSMLLAQVVIVSVKLAWHTFNEYRKYAR